MTGPDLLLILILLVRYMDNGKPTETAERFLELLKPLAESARSLYPDWRMRIYHNVTDNDTEVGRVMAVMSYHILASPNIVNCRL